MSYKVLWVTLTLIWAAHISHAQNLSNTAKGVIAADTLNGDTVSLISIAAVGDVMLGTNFPSPSYLPPSQQENLLEPAVPYLSKATLAFGNLEGTILNEGGIQKRCSNPDACYLFRMPEYLSKYLNHAGFDVMSVANNHSGDFGEEGRENTMRLMDSMQIGCCGLQVHPYTTVLRDGVRFGIIAFAPNSGTLDLNDTTEAKRLIKELRDSCDILIVSFHGGAEGRSHQHITRNKEIFYGENRGNVYAYVRTWIDAGADVVIGHGPHVPRAVDLYKGKFIAYSLGNFCTYGRFSLKGESGYAPLLNIYIDRKSGDFQRAEINSFVQSGEGGPTPDENEKAYQRIKELTRQDIPEAGLVFPGKGIILPK